MSSLGHEVVDWLIEKLRDELKAQDINNSLKSDIETLVSVLSCPVFSSLVTIQESLDELKTQLQKHPSILPVDFDISPVSGELLINIPPEANSNKYSLKSAPVEPPYETIRPHLSLVQGPPSLARLSEHEQQANRTFAHSTGGQQIRSQQPLQHSKQQFTQEQRHQQQLVKQSQQQQSFPSSSFESTSLSTSNPLSSSTVPLEPVVSTTVASVISEQMVLNSDWAEVESIELVNDGTGLGFGIVGGKSSGVIIKQLVPGGAADRDGRMRAGDHILSIAEVSLRGMSSEQVAQVLRSQGTGMVRLILARSIDPPAAVVNAALNAGSASIVAPTGPTSAIVPTRILSDMEETLRHLALAAASSSVSSNDADGSSHTAESELLAVPPPGFGDDLPLESSSSCLASTSGAAGASTTGAVEIASSSAAGGGGGGGGGVKIPIKSTIGTTGISPLEVASTLPSTALAAVASNSSKEAATAAIDSDFSHILPPPPSHASFTPSQVTTSGQGEVELSEQSEEELPEMETFEVELVKDHQGLGITIAGYVCEKEEISGIFVKSIAQGSAADLSRKIGINDQIIEVDGKSLYGFTNHQAVEVLRNSGKVVHLRLARYLRGTKYEQLQQAIASTDIPTPTSLSSSVNPPIPIKPTNITSTFSASGLTSHTSISDTRSTSTCTSIAPASIAIASMATTSASGSTIEHQLNNQPGVHPHPHPHSHSHPHSHPCSTVTTLPSDIDSDMDMPPPPPPIALPTIPRSNIPTSPPSSSSSSQAAFGSHGCAMISEKSNIHSNDDGGIDGGIGSGGHHTYRSLDEFSSFSAKSLPNSALRSASSSSFNHRLAQLEREWSKRLGPDQMVLVAQIEKFQETGGLGISLEGTVDIEDVKEVRSHHYIRAILPEGPVGREGTLKAGDEILQVNGRELINMNHVEVVSLLKDLPRYVEMVCARTVRNLSSNNNNSSSNGNTIKTAATSTGHTFFASAKNATHGNMSSNSNYNNQLVSVINEGWNGQNEQTNGIKREATSTSNTATATVSMTHGISSSSSDRLVKAKSDGSLAITGSPIAEANSITGDDATRIRSRSLEPLTGLAMWSSEPITIHLVKGDRGLGFSILDYQDPMDPSETVIVVRSLVPGGVAQLDGHLIPGDRLISVNGINLENATLDEAVAVLKGAPKGVVSIGIAKPLPLPECDSVLSSELRSGIDPDYFTLTRK